MSQRTNVPSVMQPMFFVGVRKLISFPTSPLRTEVTAGSPAIDVDLGELGGGVLVGADDVEPPDGGAEDPDVSPWPSSGPRAPTPPGPSVAAPDEPSARPSPDDPAAHPASSSR